MIKGTVQREWEGSVCRCWTDTTRAVHRRAVLELGNDRQRRAEGTGPLEVLLGTASSTCHTQSHILCPYFPFSIRLKSGFSAPNRTVRGWLVGSCLGLSRSGSGSCQLLFIGAQTLPRAGPQFSPHSHFLSVFKMSRVHYLLSCVSRFIHSCSPHLGNMYLSSRLWFSRPGYIRNNCCTLKSPAARDLPKQSLNF